MAEPTICRSACGCLHLVTDEGLVLRRSATGAEVIWHGKDINMPRLSTASPFSL
ncbi:MAG: hypothetical protein GX811_05440 [Lentisphaerae bacterium]|nr:hypothetical protein [Lentisphaerota bacterium]